MSDKHPKKIDTSHLENPNVKHEGTDVRIKPLLMFGVYLVVAAAAIHVLMYMMFKYLEEREQREQPARSPLAAERQVLPPEPRLQLAPSREGQDKPNLREHPLEELKIMRSEEENTLSNYGWVDEKAGVVRLPIDRAKQLLFERGGLPSRQQPGQAQNQTRGMVETPDQLMPSDSSGGTKNELRYK